MLIFTLFLMIFTGTGRKHSSTYLYTQNKFNWGVSDYTNYMSFYVGMAIIRTFITTPVYCYGLKLHDCMLAATGLIMSIANNCIVGTATQSWMMYYAAAITVIGSLDSTPIRSLISKMVDPTEFGKVFTFAATASAIAGLLTESVYQEIYYSTISTQPGTVFIVAAGMLSISVMMLFCLYSRIVKFERKHGTLTGKLHPIE